MKGSCPFTHWVMSPCYVHKHLASLQHQQVTKNQRLDTSCCSEGREKAIPGQFLRCRPGNQPSREGARRYSFFPCAHFQQKDLLPPQKSGADGYSVAPPALALPGKARGSQGGPSLASPQQGLTTPCHSNKGRPPSLSLTVLFSHDPSFLSAPVKEKNTCLFKIFYQV